MIQRIIGRTNIDKLEIEYFVSPSNLDLLYFFNSQETKITTNFSTKPVLGYRHCLDVFFGNTILLGKICWETDLIGRNGVYMQFENEILYNSDFKTYLTEINMFFRCFGGEFNKITKLEICYDIQLNLVRQFEKLTQTKQPSIVLYGKEKPCCFLLNNRTVKNTKETDYLGVWSKGSLINPFQTKTYYINGRFQQGKPRLQIKIYNKSKEVEKSRKTYTTDYFKETNKPVYRFEVAYRSPSVLIEEIKETFRENLGKQPKNYIELLTNKTLLFRLLEHTSERLFAVKIRVKNDYYKIDFLNLMLENMI